MTHQGAGAMAAQRGAWVNYMHSVLRHKLTLLVICRMWFMVLWRKCQQQIDPARVCYVSASHCDISDTEIM